MFPKAHMEKSTRENSVLSPAELNLDWEQMNNTSSLKKAIITARILFSPLSLPAHAKGS